MTDKDKPTWDDQTKYDNPVLAPLGRPPNAVLGQFPSLV